MISSEVKVRYQNMATFIASKIFRFLMLVLASANMLDGKELDITCTFPGNYSSNVNRLAYIKCDLSRSLHQREIAIWLDIDCTVLVCCWRHGICITHDDRITHASIKTGQLLMSTIQIFTTNLDISFIRGFTLSVYNLLDSRYRLLGSSMNSSNQVKHLVCDLPPSTKNPCLMQGEMSTTVNAAQEQRDCHDESVDGCGVTIYDLKSDQTTTGNVLSSTMHSSDSLNLSSNSSDIVNSSPEDFSPSARKIGKSFTLICTVFAGALAFVLVLVVFKMFLRATSGKCSRSVKDTQIDTIKKVQTLDSTQRYVHTEISHSAVEPNVPKNVPHHDKVINRVTAGEPPGLLSNVSHLKSNERQYVPMSGQVASQNKFPLSKDVERAHFEDPREFVKSRNIGDIEETCFEGLHSDTDYHVYTSMKDLNGGEADVYVSKEPFKHTYENWATLKEKSHKPTATSDEKAILTDVYVNVPHVYGSVCHGNLSPVLLPGASTQNFPLPPPLPIKLKSQIQKT